MTSYTSLDSVYYYFYPRAVHVYVNACYIIYILYIRRLLTTNFLEPKRLHISNLRGYDITLYYYVHHATGIRFYFD